MKANVTYNDFKGTVAADISDELGIIEGEKLENIGKYFGLDQKRFKIIGLSIMGRNEFNVSMICIDNLRSTSTKDHIVKIFCNKEDEILTVLFKRLNFVLYNKFDKNYFDLDYDEEVKFNDFHNTEVKGN